MVNLTKPFNKITKKNVLVFGDFMLDAYTMGTISRISPEAPVPVLNITHEESRPGGAGNVALSLQALGMDVTAIGRIGADSEGRQLKESLEEKGISSRYLMEDCSAPTTVKKRIIAEHQQVIRLDKEKVTALPEHLEQHIIDLLPQMMEDIDVIAVSDYNKGFLTPYLLRALIGEAKKNGIPVVVDPKGTDFSKYSGATMVKPNLSEAYAAAGLPKDSPLETVAKTILKTTDIDALVITRSQDGISLFDATGSEKNFPVVIRDVIDVTGAGDTVLSVLSCGYANGLAPGESIRLANIAAGIAIEHIGCAYVSLGEIAQRLLEYDATNKIFEEEHLFAFKQIIDEKKCTLLSIDEAEGFTPHLFKSIHALARKDKGLVVVYIRSSEVSQEFVELLATLKEVDFIIVSSENLKHMYEIMHPRKIFSLKEENLEEISVQESLL
jgi:D-glycero-beta-D-manno-heptose-7-phosphate kinase